MINSTNMKILFTNIIKNLKADCNKDDYPNTDTNLEIVEVKPPTGLFVELMAYKHGGCRHNHQQHNTNSHPSLVSRMHLQSQSPNQVSDQYTGRLTPR